MSDYIKREDALNKLSRIIDYCQNDNKVSALTALFQVGDMLMDCKAADVAEVRHGRWEDAFGNLPKHAPYGWKCSCCEEVAFYEHNYCPVCGAHMDKEG